MIQVLQDLHRSILFLGSSQIRLEVVLLYHQLVPWNVRSKHTCMKSGTKEKSWKYNSILSARVSLLVRAKEYGEQSLSMMVKGVKIVFFSLTRTLMFSWYFKNDW
jgi:hypothetical protein